MPNAEAQGTNIGFYADVNGASTLVAARRGVELSETVETIDKTHADNMQVGGRVTSTSSGGFTVEGIRVRDLKVAERGEVKGGGDLTWNAANVSDNGDGTRTISSYSGGGSPSQGDVLLVPSPTGARRYMYDRGEWEATLDKVILMDSSNGGLEASHRALQRAERFGHVIGVKLMLPTTNGSNVGDEGDVIVTEYSATFTHDDVATASVSMKGAGPLQSI